MEVTSYKFNYNLKVILWSIINLVVIVVAGCVIYLRYDGSVFFAWFASFVFAMILLLILSIPRRVVLTDETLLIHCVLDVTRIEYNRITSVRCIPARKLRWVLPIFAGCGFFGYYGIYFDIRHFNLFKIYASEWRNLVEIIDTDEQFYYISCRNGEELVADIYDHISAEE